MHLDEVLIEALNHGHVCKLSVAMRKNCLVMNFRMQTPCTPWTPKGCKFHRVVKGPVCPKFECEQGFLFALRISIIAFVLILGVRLESGDSEYQAGKAMT